MSSEPNYYAVLELPQNASAEAVQAAFTRLVSHFPEGAERESDPQYGQLRQAYEVLADPDRRRTYDALLAEIGPAPLVLNVQASRSHLSLTNAPQVVYLLLEVNPPQMTGERRRPLNLCLVLDRSTSMQGERLAALKTAVGFIMDKLAPDDVISIVTFSDRGELVLSPTHVSNKQAILTQVRQIRASGGTEIYQGLLAGLQALRQMPLNQYNNHIILLTDGHTYGDEAECVDLASRAAGQQIGLSAFGLGSEWNDDLLDRLVSFSGGQSAFIEEPEQIVSHLQKRIQGLGTTHARNVCLANPSSPNLRLQYAFKLLPFAQPVPAASEEIRLGNIEGKGALSVLLEFTLPPQSHETRISCPLEITTDIPSRNIKSFSLKKNIQFTVVADPPEAETPPDLMKAVRLLNMYRMNEKVWEEVAAGNVGMAATRLRHLTTRLLEAGELKLAQQAHAETERLTTIGSLSSEGRKKLKFGTRAMLGGMAATDDNGSM